MAYSGRFGFVQRWGGGHGSRIPPPAQPTLTAPQPAISFAAQGLRNQKRMNARRTVRLSLEPLDGRELPSVLGGLSYTSLAATSSAPVAVGATRHYSPTSRP